MDSTNERVLGKSDYHPWYVGEPNGLDFENCAVSWPRRNSWNDAVCNEDFCGFCQFDEAPVFTLRGKNMFINATSKNQSKTVHHKCCRSLSRFPF